MAHAELPLYQNPLGKTNRPDLWWLQPLVTFIVFSGFIIYSTWAAFQNAHYTFGPYISPFYSPELFGDSPHAWLGPAPARRRPQRCTSMCWGAPDRCWGEWSGGASAVPVESPEIRHPNPASANPV